MIILLIVGCLVCFIFGFLGGQLKLYIKIKPPAPPSLASQVELTKTRNLCLCDHYKNTHKEGKSSCSVATWSSYSNDYGSCPCKCFTPVIEEDPLLALARKELASGLYDK